MQAREGDGAEHLTALGAFFRGGTIFCMVVWIA